METYRGRSCYHLVSRAESNDFMSKIYKVRDRIDSLIDAEGLYSYRYRKHIREGDYKKDYDAIYDPASGKVKYADGKLFDMAPYSDGRPGGVLYVRFVPLEIGRDVVIPHHSDQSTGNIVVKVHRRETIDVPAGRFACIVIEPVMAAGGIFKNSGNLTIWVTDDARRIPVLMKSKIPVGSIDAVLQEIKPGKAARASRPRRRRRFRPPAPEPVSRHEEADLSKLTLRSIKERATRVDVAAFARPGDPAAAARCSMSCRASWERTCCGRPSRPCSLRTRREGRSSSCSARTWSRSGVAPYLVALIEKGVVSHVAMHGAGAIHDVEIALFGTTSEDVEANLGLGRLRHGRGDAGVLPPRRDGRTRTQGGPGRGARPRARRGQAPHAGVSLLAAAHAQGIPATVHVALGTDTIHAASRGRLARRSGRRRCADFRILAHTLAEARGATVLNLGSAVLLPEVFLKALTAAVNLGAALDGLDDGQPRPDPALRPRVNVIERPTQGKGGPGLALTGHTRSSSRCSPRRSSPGSRCTSGMSVARFLRGAAKPARGGPHRCKTQSARDIA
jgi:hypothetical protein